MDRDRYKPCPTSLPEANLDDESSSFLEKTATGESLPWVNTRSFKLFTALLLILTILNGLSLLSWFHSSKTTDAKQTPAILDYFLDVNDGERLPSIIERTYWDYDDDFLNFNLTIAHEAWASLLPPGEGLVALTTDEVARLNLHHSQPARRHPSKRIYLVGVFHQIHCLSVLRAQTIHLFQNPKFSLKEATYHHTMHCADVLRQALLCAADSSLIWKDEDIKWPGDGGKLACRNFEALKEWTMVHDYISD